MSSLSNKYKLALFDVDGVLTDGTLWIGAQGEVYKPFHAKDGFAVSILQQFGVEVGVLSGKDSEALRYRCQQLNMDVMLLGVADKWNTLSEWLPSEGVLPSEVVYVGDDVNDLEVLSKAGRSYCPSDAHHLVLSEVSVVCSSKGGEGVAREVAEDVLKNMGLDIQEIYGPYLSQVPSVKYEQ